jgi:hypothetical protein
MLGILTYLYKDKLTNSRGIPGRISQPNKTHAGVRGYPTGSLAENPPTPAWVWWKLKTPDPDHGLPARRPLPGSLPSCRSSICPNLPSSAVHLSQPPIAGCAWPSGMEAMDGQVSLWNPTFHLDLVWTWNPSV